jgi:hypothetical protein
MALQVSAQQAARNALAAYLGANMSGISVRGRWPEANAPLTKALTVIIAGDVEYVNRGHTIINQTNINSTTASYTWQVLDARLPLQIDAWATTDVERDDMAASVDSLLNRGSSQVTGATNQDPFGDGTSLNLLAADGFQGIADYIFDSSRPLDNPDSIQRAEYRATARGEARYVFVQTAQSPRLVTINLKVRPFESSLTPRSQLYDITSLLNTGAVIHTTGP